MPIHTIAAIVQPLIDAVTPFIQAFVYAVTAIIEAVINAVTPFVQVLFDAIAWLITFVRPDRSAEQDDSGHEQCDLCNIP